jgi:hypothetical protein
MAQRIKPLLLAARYSKPFHPPHNHPSWAKLITQDNQQSQ